MIVTSLVVGLVGVLGILLWWFRARAIPGVPVPPQPYPLIGHYNLVDKVLEDPLGLIHEYTQKFGGLTTWGISLPIERGVMFVSNPTCVKHVLKDNFPNYEKGPMFHEKLEELLGSGIFNSDGDQWRLQRKTASYMFTTNELKGFMTETFLKHAQSVCDKLEEVADTGRAIDMQQIFFQYTLDSIAEIAFGLNLQTLSASKTSHEDNDTSVSAEEGLKFAKAFDDLQDIIEKRFYFPFWKLKKWARTPSERSITRLTAVLNDFAYKVIRDRRELAKNHSDRLRKRRDLLSLFLYKNLDGKQYSDKYLRDVVLNFIIAGRDTTAQALSWTHYMLARHPQRRVTLFKEIDELTQHGQVPVDFQLAKRMMYTEAAVCETLRLYPSVPKDVKYAREDDVLPDGTPVYAGMLVCYCPWSMGRLPQLWKNPMEFTPERWLDNTDNTDNADPPTDSPPSAKPSTPNRDAAPCGTAEARRRPASHRDLARAGGVCPAAASTDKASDAGAEEKGPTHQTLRTPVHKHSAYKFTAFQAGPRTCLGKFVALLEAKLLISTIAQRYRLELHRSDQAINYRKSLTLPMAEGLLMTVHRRVH